MFKSTVAEFVLFLALAWGFMLNKECRLYGFDGVAFSANDGITCQLNFQGRNVWRPLSTLAEQWEIGLGEPATVFDILGN